MFLDNTPDNRVYAKQFLSSTTNKDELTVYLAKKALHHFKGLLHGRRFSQILCVAIFSGHFSHNTGSLLNDLINF